MNDELNKLLFFLQRNHSNSPYYNNGLSNHLSMALIALFFLGAKCDNLQRYNDKYIPRLSAIANDDLEINADNWKNYLGKHAHYLSYFRFFQRECTSSSVDCLLVRYLTPLLPGLGADAFHALIRLAYAIDLYHYMARHEGEFFHKDMVVAINEILFSLAYWADSYLPLPIVDRTSTLSAILPKMESANLSIDFSRERLIYKQMLMASRTDIYCELATQLQATTETYTQISQIVLDLYIRYPNFTLLHTFTSLEALNALLPYIDDKISAINHYWRVFIASYLTVNKATSYKQPEVKLGSWSNIKNNAIVSNDEHVIKLVYSSWAAFHKSKNKDHHIIASRMTIQSKL